MNTSQTLSDPDRSLLAQAILDGFSLPALLSRSPDAHPAQKCILALLEWFDLPHIKAAADHAIHIVERVDDYSAKAARRPIREKLSRLYSLAFDNAADSQNAIRPENSPSAEKYKNSACREARLVMHQLVRMTLSKTPRKRKSNPAPNPAPNPTPNPNPATNFTDISTSALVTDPNSSSIYPSDLTSQFNSLLNSPRDLPRDLHHTSPSTPLTSSPSSPTLSAASLLHAAGTPTGTANGTSRGTPRPTPPTSPLPLHMNLPAAPNAALIPRHLRLHPDALSR